MDLRAGTGDIWGPVPHTPFRRKCLLYKGFGPVRNRDWRFASVLFAPQKRGGESSLLVRLTVRGHDHQFAV